MDEIKALYQDAENKTDCMALLATIDETHFINRRRSHYMKGDTDTFKQFNQWLSAQNEFSRACNI